MSVYEEDREWSDRLIPEVKRIVAEHLITTGNLKQDQSEAGDLVLREGIGSDCRIAVRIRKKNYFDGWPGDVTFRFARDSKMETEWSKIIKRGWGTWLFYGFCDEEMKSLIAWRIIDLRWFRGFIASNFTDPELTNPRVDKRDLFDDKPNGDGTFFRAVRVSLLPACCIVAQHGFNTEEKNS